MNLMYKLQRKFRFGIPNLMIYITATMLFVFAIEFITGFRLGGYLAFDRSMILQGQVWRLISFAALPPGNSALWVLVSLYFYYFIGSSLENAWGSNQFTLYYLFGILGVIIAGFISGYATNNYLNLSLFFAFASLFPDMRVMLFFVIPIKVKYLAYLNWAFFLISFLFGAMTDRVAILFSLLNYFLFFGPDIYNKTKNWLKYSKSRRNFRSQMRNNRDNWR